MHAADLKARKIYVYVKREYRLFIESMYYTMTFGTFLPLSNVSYCYQ